eukprot:7826475-Pyramimonas_sp.AAC.2
MISSVHTVSSRVLDIPHAGVSRDCTLRSPSCPAPRLCCNKLFSHVCKNVGGPCRHSCKHG